MEIKLEDLFHIPLFQAFQESPHKLQRLIDQTELLHYPGGSVIINEGDVDGGALFVICQGAVTIAKVIDTESGRAKALATIRSGEFFGEMSLFDRAPRSATVICQEEAWLIKISADTFHQLVETDTILSAALLSAVIQVMTARLRRTNMELVVLYDTGKIVSRVADLKSMCQKILDRLGSTLGAAGGGITLFNDLAGAFEVVAHLGEAKEESDLDDKLVKELKSHRKGFINQSTGLSGVLLEELSNDGINSILAVPLVQNNEVYGAVFLSSPDDSSFSEADLNLAFGVSQQVSSAVENARHRQEEAAREAYKRRRK